MLGACLPVATVAPPRDLSKNQIVVAANYSMVVAMCLFSTVIEVLLTVMLGDSTMEVVGEGSNVASGLGAPFLTPCLM